MGAVSEAAKAKHYQRSKEWKERHPERFRAIKRNNRIKRDYGLTQEEFLKLLEEQPNCPGCGLAFSEEFRACIDHDHETKKVRGLLCTWCNSAIGHAKDQPARLRALADYLEKHKP